MSKLWAKYKTWPEQENQNKVYRYKSNMYRYKLAKNDQNRNCTSTSSTCTSTSLRKVPRMCVFTHFSCTYIHGSLLYFLHTSKPFPIHLGIPFLFNLSFISHLLSIPFHEFLPNSFQHGSQPIHKSNMMIT